MDPHLEVLNGPPQTYYLCSVQAVFLSNCLTKLNFTSTSDELMEWFKDVGNKQEESKTQQLFYCMVCRSNPRLWSFYLELISRV